MNPTIKTMCIAIAVLFAINTNAQDKKDKKVAVVSFYTDKIIGVSDLGLNGAAGLLDAVLDLGKSLILT